VTDQLVGKVIPFDTPQPRPTTAADLSICARDLIAAAEQTGGQPCQAQKCCPAESVTLQVVKKDGVFAPDVAWPMPAYIANAQKGDLFLCPGGSMGVIGGLLAALDPPQHFTHMGIFVDDGAAIRHCTMSEDQVQDAIGGTGDLIGKLALHEAFGSAETLALQFGWPGTVTQTVDAAWRSERAPGTVADDEKFYDGAITKKAYAIRALGFSGVRIGSVGPSGPPGGESEVLGPLVVKPCSTTEAVAPELRTVLHRIADAASGLRCHYRYFAYTKGDIAFDPTQTGPVMAETSQPDPNDSCHEVPVTATTPAMCSSMVWAAVRLVDKANDPGLVLDPPTTRSQPRPAAGPCRSFYTLPGVSHPGQNDGLYAYSEQERLLAGEALHESLVKQVRDQVATAVGLGGIRDALFASPLGFASFLLDFTLSIADLTATDPITAILDIQGRFADIMCNLFASDDASDGDGWKHPGPGESVSPDDVASWWQPNSFLSEVSCLGIYGDAVPARFRPPMTVMRPPQSWRVSAGRGAIRGFVLLAGDSRIPHGAVVELACRSCVVNPDGVFSTDVPEGRYLVTGRWFDPDTTWVWEGQAIVEVPFWATLSLDHDHPLVLSPPPASRRHLDVRIHSDVVNRHTIGHDWWDHRDEHDDLYLMDPESGAPTPDNPDGRYPYNSGGKSFPVEDIGAVGVDYSVNWVDRPDSANPFAVVFHFGAVLHEHGDVKTSGEGQTTISAGESANLHIDLFNQDAAEAPERAWITWRVTNEVMP